MRVLAIAAVIFSLGLSSFAASATPVDAYCNPGRTPNNGAQSYHAGWYRAVSGIKGVKADEIEEYNPYVYSIFPSTAYVMLEAPSRWAQVGWRKDNVVRTVYSQWYNGGGDLHDMPYYIAAPVGSYSSYEVLYLLNSWFFNWNGTQMEIPAPPAQWTPTGAEITGEVKNRATQMPGGYGNAGYGMDAAHLYLNSGYFLDAGGTWRPFNGNFGAQPLLTPAEAGQYFSYFITGWWDIEIWDKYCQY